MTETEEFEEESDESIKHTFDFYALKKLKSRERKRVTILIAIIIFLLILSITFAVLYMKSNYQVYQQPNKSQQQQAKQKQCVKSSDCGEHAYCTYFQERKTCLCHRGYVDVNKCIDVSFSINFKKRTTKDIPKLSPVTIPETTQLSVCTWFKLNKLPDGWKALFMYASYDISGENDLMMWFYHDKVSISMKTQDHDIIDQLNFTVKSWNHICWTWQDTGDCQLYYNGYLYHQTFLNHSNLMTPFPKSTGVFILGQDMDNSEISDPEQMFEGSIGGLYIYKRALEADEVMSVYEGNPVLSDILVGWWQLKGKANSSNIVEEPHFLGIP